MQYRPVFRLLVLALALPLAACASASASKPPETRDAGQSKAVALHGKVGSGLADRIVIKKAERRLYLMRGDVPFRSYKVALGYQPTGHKKRKGDGRTPEGIYFMDWRNAASNYRKALHISYPNGQDRWRAMRQGDDPGGMIMIHGQPSRRGEEKSGDWTFGCVAVSNMAIDEIWSYTEVGTPVEILP
jgi:murein L,D-transpeptidase YafK